jgi:hypothetical protein
MHQPGVVSILHPHATGNEVAVICRDDSISGISMSVCSRGSRRLTTRPWWAARLADPRTLASLPLPAAAGPDGLKGHRSVGGMRASIYNAFPEAGVDALVQFMREFERTKG